MEQVSSKYKQSMKQLFRNRSYLKVTIGMINQEAQRTAYIADEDDYVYFSDLTKPFNNYEVKELYAACEQDYTLVDNTMRFLPRKKADIILNSGIVSKELLGAVEIRFPTPLSIKGLTIDFGKAFPVDFSIESSNDTVVTNANNKARFVTQQIFKDTDFIRVIPTRMTNGYSRLRIHQITMGIGIYFDNKNILSGNKKEFISPIMESMPTLDFELTVDNKSRAFDVENDSSSVNFLEPGQRIEVLYGYELEREGAIEWLPGTTAFLKSWDANDTEMSFSGADRFTDMEEIYYKGQYYQEGVSLYDLAVDILMDVGIDSNEFQIDTYLKEIKIQNPVPKVSHKKALQLIANAGRCVLYQDRAGKIIIKSSFIPAMEASSDSETYFSHVNNIFTDDVKDAYAMGAEDYTNTKGVQYFLPRLDKYLNTGYISREVSDENGKFLENPKVDITLEAAYKCFGISLDFGGNAPDSMMIHVYRDNILAESCLVTEIDKKTVLSHEFPEFNYMELEFLQGAPNNPIVLDCIKFGDVTDYTLEYSADLLKTPKGIQLTKVKELQVIQTTYIPEETVKNLVKQTIEISPESNQYTFYFNKAVCNLSCSWLEAQAGQSVNIIDKSVYYATIEVTGIEQANSIEVIITGNEYAALTSTFSRGLNPKGTVQVWENPLVSSLQHAQDMAKWLGAYFAADREYELQYRGDPRIAANDNLFLENKNKPELLVRAYEHTVNFDGGALSGSIKARRDVNVDGA